MEEINTAWEKKLSTKEKKAYLYSHVKALFWNSFSACGIPLVILPQGTNNTNNKPKHSHASCITWKREKKEAYSASKNILCKHRLNRYSWNHWQSWRRKFNALVHERRNNQILLTINHTADKCYILRYWLQHIHVPDS